MPTHRILVLRLSSLGDIVLTSSFLQGCRQMAPEARVDLAVRDDYVALARALPGVERVLEVPRAAGAARLLRIGSDWARAGYTHVFDLHRSLRSRLLTWRLRGRLRRGFHKQELPRWALIHLRRDVYARFGGTLAMRERLFEPLRRLGVQTPIPETRLIVPEPSAWRLARRLRTAGMAPPCRLIGVAPGARWESKRWPTARWIELLRELARHIEHRFVLVGAPDERVLCARVQAALPEHCLDLCGRIDLLETAALLGRCDVVVTHDSGLMHVAEAMGRPVVALFGPTTPRFGYAPYRDLSRVLYEPPVCSPCSKNGSRPCHRPTHECMLNLDVEGVSAATLSVLERMHDAARAEHNDDAMTRPDGAPHSTHPSG